MQIYPKAKLVTNILFNREFIDYADRIIEFQTVDELADLLVKINNNELGVIYLIDEIQTYFNSLESKNIPPYIFTEISQQRKQRKLIIGTSQLWDRMAKPFREQANYEIHCRTVLNIFTIQTVIDAHTLKLDDKTGRSVGNIIKRGWFFHNRKSRFICKSNGYFRKSTKLYNIKEEIIFTARDTQCVACSGSENLLCYMNLKLHANFNTHFIITEHHLHIIEQKKTQKLHYLLLKIDSTL